MFKYLRFNCHHNFSIKVSTYFRKRFFFFAESSGGEGIVSFLGVIICTVLSQSLPFLGFVEAVSQGDWVSSIISSDPDACINILNTLIILNQCTWAFYKQYVINCSLNIIFLTIPVHLEYTPMYSRASIQCNGWGTKNATTL